MERNSGRDLQQIGLQQIDKIVCMKNNVNIVVGYIDQKKSW